MTTFDYEFMYDDKQIVQYDLRNFNKNVSKFLENERKPPHQT